MESSKRVETAARAMARYRLGGHSFTSTLNPDLLTKLSQGAEEKLWPSLVDEAKAVVEAIDALGLGRDDSAVKNEGVNAEKNNAKAKDRQPPTVTASPQAFADPAAEGLRSALAVLAAIDSPYKLEKTAPEPSAFTAVASGENAGAKASREKP